MFKKNKIIKFLKYLFITIIYLLIFYLIDNYFLHLVLFIFEFVCKDLWFTKLKKLYIKNNFIFTKIYMCRSYYFQIFYFFNKFLKLIIIFSINLLKNSLISEFQINIILYLKFFYKSIIYIKIFNYFMTITFTIFFFLLILFTYLQILINSCFLKKFHIYSKKVRILKKKNPKAYIKLIKKFKQYKNKKKIINKINYTKKNFKWKY